MSKNKIDGSKIVWNENLSPEEKEAYYEEVRKRQNTLKMDNEGYLPTEITSVDQLRKLYRDRKGEK